MAEDRAAAAIREINCHDADHQLRLAMDLQPVHLRALQAVARHGSFSRAAQSLHVTQPAVSMQIRQLERELGLPVLERVGKRAFPTKAGDLLLAHAARALGELELAVERIRELRGVVAGRVRLGTSASISIYLLPPTLRRFRGRYPDVELVVVTGNASEISRAVVENELDVGVVSLPVRARELTVTPLYTDELVAIAPARGPWRRRRKVTPVALAAEPLILFEHGGTVRRIIDDWFRRAGTTPRPAMELGNTEAIKKLVEAGLGLSITSSFCVKAEVRSRLLVAHALEPSLARQIGLVRRRDKPATPPLDAFLGALAEWRPGPRALSARMESAAAASPGSRPGPRARPRP
jgi:DNA-binding transcriptional LysR family regulator